MRLDAGPKDVKLKVIHVNDSWLIVVYHICTVLAEGVFHRDDFPFDTDVMELRWALIMVVTEKHVVVSCPTMSSRARREKTGNKLDKFAALRRAREGGGRDWGVRISTCSMFAF